MSTHTKKRLIPKTKGIETLYNKISKFSRILVLVLGVFFGLSLINNIQTILSADQRIDSAYSKLAKLKQENERLAGEVEEVESEHYTEQQARDKLGLSREGEVVVVLPEESKLKRLSPDFREEESDTLPDPNWKKWWKLFF